MSTGQGNFSSIVISPLDKVVTKNQRGCWRKRINLLTVCLCTVTLFLSLLKRCEISLTYVRTQVLEPNHCDPISCAFSVIMWKTAYAIMLKEQRIYFWEYSHMKYLKILFAFWVCKNDSICIAHLWAMSFPPCVCEMWFHFVVRKKTVHVQKTFNFLMK